MIAILEARRSGPLTGRALPRNLLAGTIVGVVAIPVAGVGGFVGSIEEFAAALPAELAR